jgi:uncharacterized protein (DUF924 family)
MVKKVLTDIHRYWFGELKSPEEVAAKEKVEMWFRRSDETDAYIRDIFGKYLAAAGATEWDVSNLTGQEQVALVILLDQFPRNIYRESGEAFAYDDKALALARQVIAGGIDRLHPAERTFVLMPLMHSEDVADQDTCVMLFAAEALRATDEHREGFRSALDFATKHRDIIRKFGRFPHRNAMIGRESTEEEAKFIAEHGRGF